jgi:FMN-dependent NADH-azoreductase
MKVLHIDSSITGQNSVTRLLSAKIVADVTAASPAPQVVRRDLETNPIPHLDSQGLSALRPAPGSAGPTAAEAANDAAILQEFIEADVVVIGAPMYNFSIPSQLKAWIDRIAVAGKTFTYTAEGPRGLAGGKKVVVASSRGGFYAPGTPYAANDFVEPYLRAVFAFLGITDLEIVRAEGVAISPEQRDKSVTAAVASVPSALAALRQAA